MFTNSILILEWSFLPDWKEARAIRRSAPKVKFIVLVILLSFLFSSLGY